MHPIKIHAKAVERLIARVRKICLALPESSERLSHGEPTWFVGAKAGKGGKVFTMFADDHHRDGIVGIWCPAAPGAQAMLIEANPEDLLPPALRRAERLDRDPARPPAGRLGRGGGADPGVVAAGRAQARARRTEGGSLVAEDVVLVDDPAPHVRRITLNRPEKRNALNHALRGAIIASAARGRPGPGRARDDRARRGQVLLVRVRARRRATRARSSPGTHRAVTATGRATSRRAG